MLLPRAKDRVNGPSLEREPGVNSDDFRREQPCDLNSHASCYKRHIIARAGFTAQCPLRRRFLGSIRSGTLCAAIPLSKNSARKSSPEDTNYTNPHEF